MVSNKEQALALIEPKDDLVQPAKKVAARIAERVPETDRQRRIPVETV